MRARIFAISLVGTLIASTAQSHGPQIQLTVDTANSNKLVTRQLFLDEPYSSAAGLTSPVSMYVMPALPVTYLGQPVSRVKPSGTQTSGPGFTYGYDQTIGSTHYLTANLNLHVAGLQIWDGTAFVATGTGKEQLGLLQSSSNINPDSVKTTPAGGDLAIAIADGYTNDAHSSVRYTLLGDGNDPYSSSRDGIYLVTLQLNGTQASPSLQSSDPFYFVLGKNATAADLSTAAASFATGHSISSAAMQFVGVPEPGTLVLAMALCCAGTAVVRRRRGGSS